MISAKKDCAVVRGAISRLRQGPSMLMLGSGLGLTPQQKIGLEQEIKERVILWAETWISRELEALLPVSERAKVVTRL